MKQYQLIGVLAVLGAAAYLFFRSKVAKPITGGVRQSQTELDYQRSLGDWNG